mmetsp:Transcript_36959/g.61284  ORF Transcript_36959/g.61284 Transcript_36959/m.61284 type:complete len:211 (+) Transcript_36959:339-971(+)
MVCRFSRAMISDRVPPRADSKYHSQSAALTGWNSLPSSNTLSLSASVVTSSLMYSSRIEQRTCLDFVSAGNPSTRTVTLGSEPVPFSPPSDHVRATGVKLLAALLAAATAAVMHARRAASKRFASSCSSGDGSPLETVAEAEHWFAACAASSQLRSTSIWGGHSPPTPSTPPESEHKRPTKQSPRSSRGRPLAVVSIEARLLCGSPFSGP